MMSPGCASDPDNEAIRSLRDEIVKMNKTTSKANWIMIILTFVLVIMTGMLIYLTILLI